MISKKSPLLLMILDGFGVGEKNDTNAIHKAETPYIDEIINNFPNSTLKASGEAVGLPEGLMGNSEVGHLNIGAGRIVNQDIMRITNDIRNGEYKKNKEINDLYKSVKDIPCDIDVINVVTPPSVTETIIKECLEKSIKRVWLQPGAENEAAIKFCRDNNIDVIHGLCVMLESL